MAADMKAVLAQSQNMDLAEQAQLFNTAVTLWTQAMNQCEGRAKDRAQRNLPTPASAQAVNPAPTSTEFSAGTTRFSGQFVRDAGATTYSGTGKIVWAQGDV